MPKLHVVVCFITQILLKEQQEAEAKAARDSENAMGWQAQAKAAKKKREAAAYVPPVVKPTPAAQLKAKSFMEQQR